MIEGSTVNRSFLHIPFFPFPYFLGKINCNVHGTLTLTMYQNMMITRQFLNSFANIYLIGNWFGSNIQLFVNCEFILETSSIFFFQHPNYRQHLHRYQTRNVLLGPSSRSMHQSYRGPLLQEPLLLFGRPRLGQRQMWTVSQIGDTGSRRIVSAWGWFYCTSGYQWVRWVPGHVPKR